MIRWLADRVAALWAPAIVPVVDELPALDAILDPKPSETLTGAAMRLRAELAETETQLAQADAGWRKAEEALRFYAAPETYRRAVEMTRSGGAVASVPPIDVDCGRRARAAVST